MRYYFQPSNWQRPSIVLLFKDHTQHCKGMKKWTPSNLPHTFREDNLIVCSISLKNARSFWSSNSIPGLYPKEIIRNITNNLYERFPSHVYGRSKEKSSINLISRRKDTGTALQAYGIIFIKVFFTRLNHPWNVHFTTCHRIEYTSCWIRSIQNLIFVWLRRHLWIMQNSSTVVTFIATNYNSNWLLGLSANWK